MVHNMQPHDPAAVLRQYGRTFYLASKLLSRKSRAQAIVLYAICRRVDSIADGQWSRSQKCDELNRLREYAIRGMLFKGTSLTAIASLIQIPLIELVEGATKDALGWPINTTADLIDYAYAVAGTVGQMMCPVLGVHSDASTPMATASAVSLGIAMQLTNIARDVAEDERMGRRYIPADWEAHASSDSTYCASAREQIFVRELLGLAELYYQRAAAGFSAIPVRNRLAIVAAALMYREIGVQIQQRGYDVTTTRVVVNKRNKIACLARAFRVWIRGVITPTAAPEF